MIVIAALLTKLLSMLFLSDLTFKSTIARIYCAPPAAAAGAGAGAGSLAVGSKFQKKPFIQWNFTNCGRTVDA